MKARELVKFLRARFEEELEIAKAAGNRQWLEEDNTIQLWPEKDTDGFISWPTRADARHAARQDPQRTILRMEANLQMLKQFEDSQKTLDVLVAAGPLHELMVGARNSYLHVLRLLAAPYKDHPDYEE